MSARKVRGGCVGMQGRTTIEQQQWRIMRRDGEQDRACASAARGSEWEEAGLLDSADVTRVLAEMRWLGTGQGCRGGYNDDRVRYQ